MPLKIQHFRGEPADTVAKLNALVDGHNSTCELRGDETFIAVRKTPFGNTVGLNIAAVVARMPKNKDRCASAIVASAIDGSRGFYRGRMCDAVDPQSGDIDVSDFYTDEPSSTPNCIIANAAELRGSPPLAVDGSVVAIGFLSGSNTPKSDDETSVGGDDDNGLPVLVVDAYVTPWQTISLSPGGITAGTVSALPKYSGTYPDGTTFTDVDPSFRNYAVGTLVDYGDTGECRWTGTAWVLWSVNETAHTGCGEM